MTDLSTCLYVSPHDIHYSQDSISCNFSDGKKIGETLDNLVRMTQFVFEIPIICIVSCNGRYYTRNNRRLWVFRQLATMNRCEYIPVKVINKLPRTQFTTRIDGYDVAVRGDDGSVTLQQFRATWRANAIREMRALQYSVTEWNEPQFAPRFGPSRNKRRKLKAKRKLKQVN